MHVPELETVQIPAAQIKAGMVLSADFAVHDAGPHVVASNATASLSGDEVVFSVHLNTMPEHTVPNETGHRPVHIYPHAPVPVLIDRTAPVSDPLDRFLWNQTPEQSREQRQREQSSRITALVNGSDLPLPTVGLGLGHKDIER